MKKIAAILTLLLAFTVSANAQEAKLSIEDAAKKDAKDLAEYVGVPDDQVVHFVSLFRQKHQIMNDATIPAARKAEMSNAVASKINATITPAQQQKLAGNPELLERLIH